MTKNFTLKKLIFFHVKKLITLALFFYLQTLFIQPARAQNPVVTNSATYDVFMNLDPSRGLNPTNFATDVSGYLDAMGAPSGSYRISTSAVTLDPTDVAKWDVYDHYDQTWYANQAAWSASPGGFNNGNIPSNWFYYGMTDNYGAGNNKITIAQLLGGTGTWGQTGRLQSHIYPYVENGKPAMQFYGYSAIGAADFLYYPADVASTKTVKFDIDASNVITHTLQKAGFLINCGTTGTGSSKTISGYILLFTWSPAGSTFPPTGLASVEIYELTNVNVDNLHNSGSGAPGTLIATSSFNTFYTKSHIELSITSTALTATIQQLDGSGNLTGSKSTMFNSQAITATGFGGFGPFVLYAAHGCTIASAFRYSNLEMAFGGVLTGNSSLESYQYAEYLDNSTKRFFVNLTNTSQTNYSGSSNDMDNAYLTRIKDDKVIFITDESAGTYLPGTLNENIKNVSSEPSDATVAAALGLPDLSTLTPAQQLAAKTAYLIFNTTLGSYGTIPIPTTTAVASLYLMDGPGTDAAWTGAKQVNEIMSWLVSGTDINIYLKSDNSINATGLTATYKLKNPGGTITTITTSTDVNGKLYFAFPKSSASGEYSVTLSYATGGSITSTVPSTSIFNYAPVPPLEGTPVISGTVQYGQTLTVTPNITSITGITGTISYKWKANGTIIAGATGSTYILTASEVGKTISCDITSDAQTGTLTATASGTVSKITLTTATVPAVNSKTYNGTTATTGGTISFSGTVNSENPACSASIVWTSANAGTSTVNVSGISLTSLADRYVLSVASLSNVTPGNNATINQATPAVSVSPTGGAITYGQTLQNSTLNTGSAVVNGFSGAIAGSYAWKTPTTKPSSAGITTATVTFTPADATNYTSIDFDISVTVAKAPLTVTANDKSKTYGASDPVLDYTFTGTLYNGDSYSVVTGVTLSTTTGASASFGTHTITVSGGSADNYNVTRVNGTLTVSKASLTVTANDKAKVYGAADPVADYTPSGELFYSDTYSVISGVSLSRATGASATFGSHTITVSGGTADNYDVTNVNGTLTVSKAAALTVTANNKSKVYGATDPVLDYTPSGTLYYSDTYSVISSVSLNTATGSSASFGTHTITATGGSAENYDVNHVNGTLTVSKAAALTVTANDKSKVYGASDPVPDYTPSGTLYYSDTYNVISGVSLTTSTGATATFGTHTITVSGGSANNYFVNDVNGTLTISKATLTAVADNKSKIYGHTNPLLTITYQGFRYSDQVESLTIPPVASTSATSASNAGTYAINLTGGSANNYNFEYTNGTLEIVKADQVLTFETIPTGLRTSQSHELVATATSGLPVRFESSASSIAEVSGNNMAVLKEGNAVITAIQEGNQNWNPAANVTQTIVTLPTFENLRSLFTPNNDGMNDYWYIPDIEKYGTISVQIYNRFGKLLYKSSAYKNDWDGTYNGTPLPDAAYYYLINSSEKGLIKGVVNIVR